MFHVMLYVFCGFQCICNDSTNSPFIKAFCNTPGVMSLTDDLKMAWVTPIHKKNSKLDAGNYRPVVSILSTIVANAGF